MAGIRSLKPVTLSPLVMDPDFVNDVVDHMNGDHGDAVLNIARHFGDRPQAVQATLVGLDDTSLSIKISNECGDETIEIALTQNVNRPEQIRGILIHMARTAREG